MAITSPAPLCPARTPLGLADDSLAPMCDYSLESVQSRPAKVGDRLTTRLFGTSTRGFSAPENKYVAVCLLPGTELCFANEVKRIRLWQWNSGTIKHKTAIFREINQGIPRAHHDALEFPDGQIVLLTLLLEGQQATVLQLPATLERAKAAQPDKAKV